METAHSEREKIPTIELEEWTEVIKHLLLYGLAEAATPLHSMPARLT